MAWAQLATLPPNRKSAGARSREGRDRFTVWMSAGQSSRQLPLVY